MTRYPTPAGASLPRARLREGAFLFQDELTIRRLLETVHRIAVLGIKNGVDDDARRVPAYLQAQGYRILPVNPRLESVLDEPCYSALSELPEAVDLINVFRAPEHIPGHVDEILALRVRPSAVWMQLGIRHEESALRLHEAGIAVVQNRCIEVDHRRWIDA